MGRRWEGEKEVGEEEIRRWKWGGGVERNKEIFIYIVMIHTHTPGSSQTLSNKNKSTTLPASASFAYDETLPCLEKAKQRKEPMAVVYDSKVITDHPVSIRVLVVLLGYTWSCLLLRYTLLLGYSGHSLLLGYILLLGYSGVMVCC